MRRRVGLLPLVVMCVTLPIITHASTWRLVTVAQPVFGEGCISVRDVLYGEGSFITGAEVALTCDPNAIRMVGEGMDGQAENRNAANLVGLSVEASPVWDGRKFFDALTVTLDASRADSMVRAGYRYDQGFAPDSIVEATVMCLRINAARSGHQWPGRPPMQTKYLRLRVFGPARLHRFARLYKVAPLPLPDPCYDLGRAGE